MKITSTVLPLILVAGCAPSPPPQVTIATSPSQPSQSFFLGIDASKLSEPARSTVVSADKDIDLVLRGYPPACKDSPDSGESDGGTLHYRCKHYKLTVMRSIYQVGNVQGFIYGPVITFPGDYPISYVRFYSSDELTALLRHHSGR